MIVFVLEPCRFVHSHLFGRKIWKFGDFNPIPLEKSAKKTILAVFVLFTIYLPCLVLGILRKSKSCQKESRQDIKKSRQDVIAAYSCTDIASIILGYTTDIEEGEEIERKLMEKKRREEVDKAFREQEKLRIQQEEMQIRHEGEMRRVKEQFSFDRYDGHYLGLLEQSKNRMCQEEMQIRHEHEIRRLKEPQKNLRIRI